MYAVEFTNEMKRNMRLMAKRGKDMTKLEVVLELLAAGSPLPERYKDHPLKGDWAGCRECHVAPDWLLVYKIFDDALILMATNTGTHSDIYG